MEYSILPLYVVVVFAFSIGISHRAARLGAVTRDERQCVDILMGAFFIWALICTAMGISGIHTAPILLAHIPFLWQAVVPVLILASGLLFSDNLRQALRAIAATTPMKWLVWIQILRIGALGGIIKGLRGEIDSSYVFWVGIPDLLFGISALALSALLLFRPVGRRPMMIWNLLGPAIILLPTFLFMNTFMKEPGFIFIFEFPMVLAPGIVVPFFIFINLLAAWKHWEAERLLPEAGTSEIGRANRHRGDKRLEVF